MYSGLFSKQTYLTSFCLYTTRYTFESDFAKELKAEVRKAAPPHQQYGTYGFFARAIVYVLLTAYLTYHWTFIEPSYTIATFLGISLALIGLNVQHDANHGAASSKQWINEMMGYGADAIGGSKWHWIGHHWTHHAYTNHAEKDPDVTAGEPVLIFTNYAHDDPNRQWYHRFQVLLFLPAMAGYWLTKASRWADTQIHAELVSGVLRLLHLGIFFVPPVWHHGWEWTSLYQTLTIGVSGSLVLGILFSLSHNFEGSYRLEPSGDVAKPTTEECWYKSQVESSCTYGGFVSGCLTGGLNYQIEHHLFPRMSSAHYPTIAPIVRRICKKHNVHYTYFPWVWDNLASLVRTLHATGNGKHKTL